MSSSPYKISSNLPEGLKIIKAILYIHHRSLNDRHFGMAEATR
jgi:hypothetical protein